MDYIVQTKRDGRWTLVPGAVYPEGTTYEGGRTASNACVDAYNRLRDEFPNDRFRVDTTEPKPSRAGLYGWNSEVSEGHQG